MFRNFSAVRLGISGSESEIIEPMLSYGFKGLDLDLVEFAARVQALGLVKARRLIDSARLKIGSCTLPIEWQNDEAYRRQLVKLPEWAGLAQQLGCTRVVTAIETGSDYRPYHENFQFHAARFNDLADKLAPYNIRLGVQMLAPARLRKGRTYQFLQTADAAALLVKSVSSKNVGLALDTWHWHLGGGTLDHLRSLDGRIVSVVLSDIAPGVTADSADDASRKLPAVDGVIDVVSYLKLLADWKYDGPVTPAAHASTFAGLGRDKTIKQAGESLDQVFQAAGIATPGRRTASAAR